MRLSRDPDSDTIQSIFGLAAKYDLLLFDPHQERLLQPLREMGEYASATFWPHGAIQAGLAGGGGLLLAIVAWVIGIPIVSGVAIVIGGFLFVMAVYTFIHEGRVAMRRRRVEGAGGPR
jgi:hypothetical protein